MPAFDAPLLRDDNARGFIIRERAAAAMSRCRYPSDIAHLIYAANNPDSTSKRDPNQVTMASTAHQPARAQLLFIYACCWFYGHWLACPPAVACRHAFRLLLLFRRTRRQRCRSLFFAFSFAYYFHIVIFISYPSYLLSAMT